MKLVFASLFVAATLHAEAPPISAERRAAMLARFDAAVASANLAIAQAPDRIALYSQRGDAHLFLARFKEAVADFEKMIALDPAQDAPHWRLGIAYFFAGDYKKSARQFEKYHAYDGRDRENGIWKFLAQAKDEGIEKARGEMLVYTEFDREPFPILYEMFAGSKSSDDVMARVANRPSDAAVSFFAHYYIGLNEWLLGRKASARSHLNSAVSLFSDSNAKGGPGYMWQVARLHYEMLASDKTATAPE